MLDREWSFSMDKIVDKTATAHRVFVLSWGVEAGGGSLLPPLFHSPLWFPTQHPLCRETQPQLSLIVSHADRSSYPPLYHSHLFFTFQCAQTSHRTEPILSLLPSFTLPSVVTLVDA